MAEADIPDILSLTEGASIEQALRLLAERFKDRIVFSSSLSFEDQVITHIIFSNQIPIKVFTLDTGRLFEESYKVLHHTNQRYRQNIRVYFPEQQQVEQLVNRKGVYSFYNSVDDRKECCFIRKVAPLNRALEGQQCWITGIRAAQSENRKAMNRAEWDEAHQLIKFHPLLHWTEEEVKDYIRKHDIPYNQLHEKGFPSIGCAPCTRAVQAGEDIRAGRWWWEDQSKKECGLHVK